MKTSQPSWQSFLEIKPSPPNQNNRFLPPRTCLVGVGNDLRGDDSAGLAAVREIIARGLTSDLFLPLEGGPAPENITATLRKFQPEQVIFLDAAHMDEPPGAIRWIELNTIDGMSASSHSLPLSILAEFIELEMGCTVRVLGIQPEQNEVGETLSEPVRRAVAEIVEAFTPVS
ncbi:MAG: hydrogenase 3 maturation endopeptidase HyCI [Chloroflexi bacterium]|nr:hydrogenase 3 maturation endopeptidase HyCI [Chloroflexota bacterium]